MFYCYEITTKVGYSESGTWEKLKTKPLEPEEPFYFLTFWQTFSNPVNCQNCQNREIWKPESKMMQLVKKGVLKSFANLQENTCVGVPF